MPPSRRARSWARSQEEGPDPSRRPEEVNTHESVRVHLLSTLELWAVEQGPSCCRGLPGGGGVGGWRRPACWRLPALRTWCGPSTTAPFGSVTLMAPRGAVGVVVTLDHTNMSQKLVRAKIKDPPPLFPSTVQIKPMLFLLQPTSRGRTG